MLINSSYFTGGERNIPNTHYSDVSGLISEIISIREPEYLLKALGYELYSIFKAGIIAATPDQRYRDILLGAEFIGLNGEKKRWEGLVSLTEPQANVIIWSAATPEIFFTVGVGDAPAAGATEYNNSSLVGKTFKVKQRGVGPLEQLEPDESNNATADIATLETGGFRWLNGFAFSDADKYTIEIASSAIDANGATVVAFPVSPIADYVYYYWLKHTHTQVTNTSTVKTDNANSTPISPKYKATEAWNSMVRRTSLLVEFLMVNSSTYPEYQYHLSSRELKNLITKINLFF